jgi:hypothetical protein
VSSWAGMCPGNQESAGKRKSGKTRKSNRWLRSALVEAARSASRKEGSYLAPSTSGWPPDVGISGPSWQWPILFW